MTFKETDFRILSILADDGRTSAQDIARMTGLGEAEAAARVQAMEEQGFIVGYPALINWADVGAPETVSALIEVRVTPQRDMGFDAIAARIYRFEEVKSASLMSGGYDLMLEVEAATLRELALFVSERLSTIENVLSTATHFVLKKYKVDGRILAKPKDDNRLAVSP